MASEAPKDGAAKPEESEEGGIPLHLLKNLRKSGEGGETGSSNENNSDNSALVSIGNTSFGFNFDSEEQSPNNSDRDRNENSEDSDDQQREKKKGASRSSAGADAVESAAEAVAAVEHAAIKREEVSSQDPQQISSSSGLKTAVSMTNVADAPPVTSGPPQPNQAQTVDHMVAAADAVANLQAIATSNSALPPPPLQQAPSQHELGAAMDQGAMSAPPSPMAGRKRKSIASTADEEDNSAGYHTDDEGRSLAGSSSVQGNDDKKAGGRGGGKKKRLDEKKREERNMREKERSLRISKQINELRNLLSSGGVIVPKGTKSSVLTEAANYIRMLQQHQYRSELDRHQLIQQMQMIGNGAHGAQAAKAIRHVAAQNGVWSLGNFGGVPPKSAMSFYQPTTTESSSAPTEEPMSANPAQHPNKIDTSEYKFVFNSCGVAMAIASLGGAFIDCNQLFCQLSNFSKQEICGLTIFNLTARQDLQHAFDLISQMISPPLEARNQEPRPIVLRGSMKNRNDIGLSISLVKGDDGIAKCFCATLIKNPSSPFDTAKPIPVSFDSIQGTSFTTAQSAPLQDKQDNIAGAAPAFTLG